jgi:hypothetical protein
MLAILVIAYHYLGLACVSASISNWGENEPLAGYHAAGNDLNLIMSVFAFLCRSKDDREHMTLICTIKVMNDGMIGIFAAEGGQESLFKAQHEMVAHANGVALLGGKGPCRVKHTLIIFNDSSSHGLSVGASQRLSNVL